VKHARFADRGAAGRELASRLPSLHDPVVLGLPRGGVPVAFEIAVALSAPLDVLLVRKIGVPFQPELAMGAIGEDGVRVVNVRVMRALGLGDNDFAAVDAREQIELERRVARYRADRDRFDLRARTAVVVDDGVATGSTAQAACEVARHQGAANVVFAAPVAPPGAIAELRMVADDVVTVVAPDSFSAIGEFYDDFRQVPDDEVVRLLAQT
jgi:putative phosphoribosyl transferase